MIRTLRDELLPVLKSASEIYVAVALMNDYGLKAIEDLLPPDCLRVYLVGVHLPTPPSVFRKLLALQAANPTAVFCRVWREKANYHPKVYLIRSNKGELIAFAGSANATRGGFERNVEISFKISDPPQYANLFEWFTESFMLGKVFDHAYIDKYESTYRRNKQLQATQKSNTDNFTDRADGVPGINLVVPMGQFFTQGHFDAFAETTHLDTSPAAVRRRKLVRDRMIQLDKLIVPKFAAHGITNLHNHPSSRAITSQHFHSRGNVHITKEAIWLHYGKSKDELLLRKPKKMDFGQHLRIQIILRNTNKEAYIGTWLYVAKGNGSYHDRHYLQTQLPVPGFLDQLFNHLKDLGNAYWIVIDKHTLLIEDMTTPKILETHLRKDQYKGTFNIGRLYQPDDPDLSEDNIVDTVLVEFAKLYKVYDLIKDR
jgi:hypothetical protein